MIVCDFCNKSNGQVEQMITHSDKNFAAICNECVDVCNTVIAEKKLSKTNKTKTDISS